MLHDLFLMSEYFEPPFSCMAEEDLIRNYGTQALYSALSLGLIEQKCAPCASGMTKNFYILSQSGVEAVMRQHLPHAPYQAA
ncbi:MAG: hypothetical protein AAF569_07630 [Pseudomonadota bacterium]